MIPDPHLREALEAGTLIACCGPGISAAAGVSSLSQFGQELYTRACASAPDDPALGAIEEALERGRVGDALDMLMDLLGSDFQRNAERSLSDQGHDIPPVASSLASMREQLRAVYTTTLDRLIERAFAGRWPSFAVPRADLVQRRRLVFKLYGTLEFRQSWVLTHEQRRRELREASLRRQLLHAAYKAHHLLLLGFTPDSVELDEFLELLPVVAENQTPQHWILFESCSVATRRRLERRGFLVLVSDTSALLSELGGSGLEPSRTVDGCPYPGLEAFDEELSSVFHGRHAEVSQAASRLGGLDSHYHWLSIEGPSGVGKSSFAHAGVIPALRDGFAPETPSRWIVARMRPGRRPAKRLATTVASALGLALGDAPDALLARLRTPAGLRDMIARHCPPGHGFVLLVDQLEELVTFSEPSEQREFSRAVAGVLGELRFYLVTTIRSDFVARLQAKVPAFGELLNERAARYALPPMTRVGLREAIVEPARAAGVEVDPELVEQILVDADPEGSLRSGDGGPVRSSNQALPLVAHVLRGLWDTGMRTGKIGLAEYRDAGGVTGALSRSAEAVIAGLDAEDRAAVKSLLLGLVTVDTHGAASRRSLDREQALALAGGPDRGERLLSRLTGASAEPGTELVRLLAVRRDGDADMVDIVHETLLSEWDTLNRWIEENTRQLLIDAHLEYQALRWRDQGSKTSELPVGDELNELLSGRPRGPHAGLLSRYQRALARAQRRRRRRLLLGAWIGMALFAGLSLLFFRLYRSAATAQKDAETAQKDAETAQKDAESEALVSAVTAQRARAAEIEQVVDREALSASMLVEKQRRGPALASVFEASKACTDLSVAAELACKELCDEQPDCADGCAQDKPQHLHDCEARTPLMQAKLDVHFDRPAYVGATLEMSATPCADMGTDRRRVRAVEFSPLGDRMVVLGDRCAMMWSNAGPTSLEPPNLEDWGDKNYSMAKVAFSANGDVVIGGGRSEVAVVIEAGTDGKQAAGGRTRVIARPEPAAIFDAAIASDGRAGLFVSADGSATLWDGQGEQTLLEPDAERILVTAAMWTETTSGTYRLAAAERGLSATGRAGQIRMWRYSGTPEPVLDAVLDDPVDSLWALVFSPEGLLVGGSEQGEIHVWAGAESGMDPPHALQAHSATITTLLFSPPAPTTNEVLLLSASHDGDAKLWSLEDGQLELRFVLEGHLASISSASFSTDGRLVATGSDDYTIRVWDVETGELLDVLAEHHGEVNDLAFCPASPSLISASDDGTLRLWRAFPALVESEDPSFVAHDPETEVEVERDDKLLMIGGRPFDPPGDPAMVAEPAKHREHDEVVFVGTLRGAVHVIDPRNHTRLETGASCVTPGRAINDLAADPNEEWLAVAGEDGVWLCSLLDPDREMLHFAGGRDIDTVAFSSDGSRIRITSEDEVEFWRRPDDSALSWLPCGDAKDDSASSWLPGGDAKELASLAGCLIE